MTVSSILSRWSYTGNGATTAFAYTNRIFADSDLKVYVDGALKVLTTDYTVSGVDNPGGGNVTFGAAPANGASVVIVRDVPATQPVDYQPNDPFPAETHEKALDRATVLVQQLETDIARSLRQAEADTSSLGALPDGAARAGKYLGFDASGNPTTNTSFGAWKGDWVAGYAYIAGDVVRDGANGADTGNVYVCVSGHSSGVWATDLAGAKWQLAVDVAAITAEATAAAAAAIQGLDLSWHVEYPAVKTYTLVQKSSFTFDVDELAAKIGAGTSVSAKLQIDGVDVTDSAGTFTTTESTTTPSAARRVAAGQTLALVVTAMAGSPTNFSFTVKCTRV